MALAIRTAYPAGFTGLNAPAIRLTDSQIAGAFASNLLGSQAYAVEKPAYALAKLIPLETESLP